MLTTIFHNASAKQYLRVSKGSIFGLSSNSQKLSSTPKVFAKTLSMSIVLTKTFSE